MAHSPELRHAAPSSLHTAEFRFYEELNDFLPMARRKRTFAHAFDGTPAVKDTIESLGVPHTEVDLILVDGTSVRFAYRLRGGERVAVYPMFERFDLRPLYRLRPRPLRRTRFVADVHLGVLARRLRLLGFDTVYERHCDDARLASTSVRERRILLTRDVGLLKRGAISRGHWVRATDPQQQIQEVIRAFSLQRDLKPFTRCMACNGELRPVERAAVAGRVPPRVYARFRRFMHCARCERIYWHGSHYEQLKTLTRTLRQETLRDRDASNISTKTRNI
ncbi:Mut7-C RNAse domain-containing protein [Dyella subtropica]|uniref:Mut7-C RNAse domain-containing protein n=1 Tax=Dyella subtropica TaxID=2992127 RepID=UPI0022596088|nr:Mut7-C RNAse domain-containing protein [Dyella subtropica]